MTPRPIEVIYLRKIIDLYFQHTRILKRKMSASVPGKCFLLISFKKIPNIEALILDLGNSNIQSSFFGKSTHFKNTQTNF